VQTFVIFCVVCSRSEHCQGRLCDNSWAVAYLLLDGHGRFVKEGLLGLGRSELVESALAAGDSQNAGVR
jgi:hypothetical protein